MLDGLLESDPAPTGLSGGLDNLETLTAIQPAGAIITTDPGLDGPTQFISGGQPKDELIQPDGKRLVAGYVGSNAALARFNIDGTPDSSFGSGGTVITDLGSASDQALNISLRPDGKIVTIALKDADGFKQVVLERYNPDGSLDNGFGVAGKAFTGIGKGTRHSIVAAVLKDGRIHVTGFRADGSDAAWEYDANGRNGFDRMAGFVGTVRPASVSSITVPTLAEPGTFASYSRLPFVGPVPAYTSGLAELSDIDTVTEGDEYSTTIPAGKDRVVFWGDGTSSTLADSLSGKF